MSAKLTSRRVKFWTFVIVVGGILLTLALWLLFRTTHLEPVDVTEISVGTPNSSGIPTPIAGDIIIAASGTWEPHFPFSDFREARKWAKGAAFQMVVKQKLPDGIYCISVKNSESSLLLPLRKVSPELYVSSPIIILDPHADATYFLGYGILRQTAGTSESIDFEVERVVRGREKKPDHPRP